MLSNLRGKSIICFLLLSFSANSFAGIKIDTITAKNIAQAEVLRKAASELTFTVEKVDFSATLVSPIVPRGGGFIVDVAAVVAETYACVATVVLTEDGSVSELYPTKEFNGAFCGEIGRGGVVVGNH